MSMEVAVNREGNRLLFLPYVLCWGIDRLTDRFFVSLRGADATAEKIGEALEQAYAYIERTGPIEMDLEEQQNCWRHDTKYKTWRSFAHNNDFVTAMKNKDGSYYVCAYPPRNRDLVGDEVCSIRVPVGVPPVALGRAVLDAYAALDGWKAAHPGGMPPAAPPDASANACDGSVVTLPVPAGGFVEETPSAAEVLLQWSLPGRDGEPVAWLYLEEGDWDGPGGDDAWDEWVGRWRVSCGEPRSVSRGAWDGGPFGVRWEARNASSLSIALVAPVGGGAAVRLCLDVESPGRRARMAARLEQALGDAARATRITPAPPEN